MADTGESTAPLILNEPKSVPFHVEYFAGWIGGIGQVLTAQPFDIIKVRLQTQDPKNPKFNGMGDCFRQIMMKDGPLGFYKGTLSPLIGVGTICAIQFMVFQKTRETLASFGWDKHSDSNIVFSGMMCGLCASPVVSVVEHLRIRMQIQGENQIYSGSIDAGKKIYKKYGIRGVAQGWTATFFRDFTFFGLYYGLYEYVIRQFKNDENSSPGMIPIIAGGSVCGIISWAIHFPVDSLKSIAQTQDFENPKYRNYRELLIKNATRNNIGKLYNGIGVCMLRAMPANAITFLFYELAKTQIFGY